MALTPWRNVVEPHDDIKKNRVKQNDFAASLADVLGRTGNPDYYDPNRFFDRTFLTGGLRQLAGEVVGRLTGQGDGDAVMQIQTPFGGGKTHTLICLYHLAKNGAACFDHPALKTYWLERGWKVPPSVPVAAFDGNHVGLRAQEVEPGLSVQTMWGHIAWQLAGREGYALVAQYDADRISPGGDDIDALLRLAGGGLIILDEVVNYIETAAGKAVGRGSTLAAQTLTFLQRLTVRAGAHPNVVVAATLPKSSLELHGTASVEALDRLKKIFGRVQKVREPIEGDEVHEIIRRRLFLNLGTGTGNKSVDTRNRNARNETIDAYVADLKSRPQIPEEAKDHAYRKRFEQSYPFHPYLIDVLNRFVAANPKFQRTRGALRLLALVVADLVKKKHQGALIHLSDIDLDNEEIRSELLELVDRQFRSALDADIIGGGANAAELDAQQSEELKPWRVATGLATTTFIFTCEAGNRSKGATLAELNLASARPNIDFSTIPGVILQMKERFHFLNTEGERYRFSTTPNLNRILLDAKEGVDPEKVRERIESDLRRLLSQKLSPYLWPLAPGDVPDTQSNKLVVMPPEVTYGPSTGSAAKEKVLDLLQNAATTERARRNTMVFLLADETEIGTLREAVRSLISIEDVDGNQDRHNLSDNQLTQLQALRDRASRGATQQILRTWRYAAWGGANGGDLVVSDMGQPPSGTRDTLTDRVLAHLREKHRYLEQMTPLLLVHPKRLKVWPIDEQTLDLKALPDHFRNLTHLPMLASEQVLKQTIADGVRAGNFALGSGTGEADAKVLHYKTSIAPAGVFLEEGYLLLRAELADRLLQEEEAKKKPPVTPPSGGGGIGTVEQPPPGGGGTTTGGGGGAGTAPKGVRKVQLDVAVPYEHLHTFHAEIINALARKADSISISVRLEAASEAGFSESLIEDTVREELCRIFGTDDALKVE